ncbi:MAG TPA: GntR family transcriptional regulator [Angustibacter sp.]|nr:GntR family transcriptional regulator [Angustibacter sp.]
MSEIRRERLADQAYEILRDRILRRELLPGQRLSVPELARELELSRSPVREAVQRLVSQGLGTERPRQGAVVAVADVHEIHDLYAVRAVLEGLSAALATAVAGPGFVAELEELLDAQRAAFEAGDGAGVIRADIAFHRRMATASGNAELVRVLDPVHGRSAIAMLAGELRSWPERAMAEHRSIIDAVAANDPVAARQRSEEHVLLVRSRLLGKLADEVSDLGAFPADPQAAPAG